MRSHARQKLTFYSFATYNKDIYTNNNANRTHHQSNILIVGLKKQDYHFRFKIRYFYNQTVVITKNINVSVGQFNIHHHELL